MVGDMTMYRQSEAGGYDEEARRREAREYDLQLISRITVLVLPICLVLASVLAWQSYQKHRTEVDVAQVRADEAKFKAEEAKYEAAREMWVRAH
jgi:hypothetical protein